VYHKSFHYSNNFGPASISAQSEDLGNPKRNFGDFEGSVRPILLFQGLITTEKDNPVDSTTAKTTKKKAATVCVQLIMDRMKN
jgi:hypothetical protein